MSSEAQELHQDFANLLRQAGSEVVRAKIEGYQQGQKDLLEMLNSCKKEAEANA